MKYFISILLICVTLHSVAQINFVKNPNFEQYSKCPDSYEQLSRAKFWRGTVDSLSTGEYYNACAFGNIYTGLPNNGNFYQYPRSGYGMIGLVLYYDKTLPPPPPIYSFNYRDYAQVRLYNTLSKGKTYCVTFFVNTIESYYYAHNKIGAYLDDGSINTAVDSGGEEIISVVPQVYTKSIIKDTLNWVKIEGTFVAKGDESYITIGNFFPNDSVITEVTNYWFGGAQYSYYLIDDVSVVPIDAKANAGEDRWVELGKTTQIGPVEDSTARGMDCKWYYKGSLIDSGNVITVNASTIKYAVDTYVVVQNVCGNITRDTMLLKTTSLSAKELEQANGFSLYPNPSNGTLTITSLRSTKQSVTSKVYDLLGREVYRQTLNFSNKVATLQFTAITGVYILELLDSEGNVWRERIVIE